MYSIATIAVAGPDAPDFLQGQLTNDLRRLAGEREILAAWCSPKGRVIWFGTVGKTGPGYGLAAPADMAADIVARLLTFRFRAKVDFEVVDEGRTVDPAVLVAHGIPWIGREQAEQFTPHMLNLDLLDAVSFDKGCYTGQEIVARTQHRGATKRRTLRFNVAGAVSPGDKVQLEGRDVGEVLNVAANELLAVVPLDSAGQALTVNGAALEPLELPYL